MSTENPQPESNPESKDRSGLYILLVFMIGIPLIGILATLFGYNNN